MPDQLREFTELQKQVMELAKEKLSEKPWFSGICLDNIPCDLEIMNTGIEEAVDTIIFETAMWDDPDFFDQKKED